MIPLTDEKIQFYKTQKVCHICKGWFVMIRMKKKI